MVHDKVLMINSSKIENNYLVGNFITEFDSDFNILQNIKSDKIDVSKNKWIVLEAKIFKKNEYEIKKFRISNEF